MKIRFQADNDLDEDILRAVKRLQPAINFQRAPELGLHTGIPDPDHRYSVASTPVGSNLLPHRCICRALRCYWFVVTHQPIAELLTRRNFHRQLRKRRFAALRRHPFNQRLI